MTADAGGRLPVIDGQRSVRPEESVEFCRLPSLPSPWADGGTARRPRPTLNRTERTLIPGSTAHPPGPSSFTPAVDCAGRGGCAAYCHIEHPDAALFGASARDVRAEESPCSALHRTRNRRVPDPQRGDFVSTLALLVLLIGVAVDPAASATSSTTARRSGLR